MSVTRKGLEEREVLGAMLRAAYAEGANDGLEEAAGVVDDLTQAQAVHGTWFAVHALQQAAARIRERKA